ncbi:MAG: EAL domain-containing protein [Clostridia bacterium]|nr:EAL domain-containing protein [Clostridia bacterium]MCI2013644.1 EAL domain-containing protein [Clostridia bacterium]
MKKRTVLIVDDNKTSRKMLKKILDSEYEIVEAENGEKAISILNDKMDVSVIVLDIVMPVMNGYEFLQICSITKSYQNIPIIVLTADKDTECESKCLALGAWDFVAKPYDTLILQNRIKNAVKKCNAVLIETDQLTDLFNKAKFFRETKKMLYDNDDKKFAFVRFDIDGFSKINSFYGDNECDKLLVFIANELKKMSSDEEYFTYGRIEHDIFCFCTLYNKNNFDNLIAEMIKSITHYSNKYYLKPSFGVYVIEEMNFGIERVYDLASFAAMECKGKYGKFVEIYDSEFTNTFVNEQYILNEMEYALESGQFEVYFQPKYNSKTNLPEGAEALARWVHPKRGVILPDKFIPIFERNGFVSRLDYYVWDVVCRSIKKWIDDGIDPYPISVNVSKVELYNPRLADILDELVKKYEILPKYLNLEIAESVWVENPQVIGITIKSLKNRGFNILLDNFGSGYLSLNTLKGVIVDALKIDINYLPKDIKKEKSNKILVSDIRMAKWLNLPVIIEGVEDKNQVQFFKNVGCDYIQGFYFAKPMPIKAYELLLKKNKKTDDVSVIKYKAKWDDFCLGDTEIEKIFENSIQPLAIYEYTDRNLVILRANEAFFELIECDDNIYNNPNFLEKYMNTQEINEIKEVFEEAVKTKDNAQCEYMRINKSGKVMWLSVKVRFIAAINKRNILFGILSDVSLQKNIEIEFNKYRKVADKNTEKPGMLIVDNMEINRVTIKDIFKKEYNIYEAENSEQAIETLKENKNDIEIVIVDLCMSIADANNFLKTKNTDSKIASIATVAILSDAGKNINMLEMGVNDYITRPFVSVLVREKIKNAISFNSRFRQMVKEHEKIVNKKSINSAKSEK